MTRDEAVTLQRATRVRKASLAAQVAQCDVELAALEVQVHATRRSFLEAFYRRCREALPEAQLEEIRAHATIDAGEEGAEPCLP